MIPHKQVADNHLISDIITLLDYYTISFLKNMYTLTKNINEYAIKLASFSANRIQEKH